MKRYIVAYACEPNQGGEHAVGWKFANEMANNCKVDVITRVSNKSLIESQNDNEGLNFIYIENKFGMLFKPKGKFSYFYYFLWQFSVFLFLYKKVRPSDLVHLITFGNLHLPNFLFMLKGKLIIGPMGGGAICDVRLINKASTVMKLKALIHKLINKVSFINPFLYFSCLKSHKIFVRTKDTKMIVPKRFHEKVEILLETGVDYDEILLPSKAINRKIKTIVTTARFIASKNIDQSIEVFKLLKLYYPNNELEFNIIGDGPLKDELQRTYSSVPGVNFLGRKTNDEVKELLKRADLFLSCSIHEGGTHSLFEAAMSNLPIACYDISGMQVFPPEDSAIKIQPSLIIGKNVANLASAVINSFEEEVVDNYCKNATNYLLSQFNWSAICKRVFKYY